MHGDRGYISTPPSCSVGQLALEKGKLRKIRDLLYAWVFYIIFISISSKIQGPHCRRILKS